ncbi:MAG: methyltransferase domain-containing protein [Woeseiaceae bacterium]
MTRDEAMETSAHFPAAARQWLASPLGEALLAAESRNVEEALDGIFGEECVQLGLWGGAQTFLRHARTQRKALIEQTAGEGVSAVGLLHRLPLANDSVDCVLLPHVLDYSDRPHAILREVDRVLTAHGHLVILGFKTGGLWGIRRLVPGAGLPPGADYLVSERRLRDWLQLLDMQIHGITRYFFRWPLPGKRRKLTPRWEARGQRWWPEFAACYMLTAQKRVVPLTPVRPQWRHKTKVVGGLAGTTTNRVSRIRFDPKS